MHVILAIFMLFALLFWRRCDIIIGMNFIFVDFIDVLTPPDHSETEWALC